MSALAIKALVENLIVQLDDFYKKDLWVVAPFVKRVATLDPETAFRKNPAFHHSVAQIVSHMIAWRQFVIEKLKGNDDFDILGPDTDWPDHADWQAILQTFATSQEDLLEHLKGFPTVKWDQVVPGRTYTFGHLLNGILQHDLYHYGQIGIILAAPLPKGS